MKEHSVRLFLFSLTLCLGLATVWIFTHPNGSQQGGRANETPQSTSPEIQNTTTEVAEPNDVEGEEVEDTRLEYFADEKNVGRRGKNKIEIRCFSRGADRFAELKFYFRTEYDAWVEIQSFKFEKDGLTGCDPVIEDFNNDGLKDFTYRSMVAARGSNEVRKLFIYDKAHNDLVYIKNSEEYPNLAYNKKLHCLDSFMVYGATSTVFLRIEGDTLREFAEVSTGDQLVVTLKTESGEARVVRRRKMNPDNFGEVFRRFSTFDPPR